MINRNLYLQIATPVLVLFLGIFALWFFLLKPISNIGQEYKNNRLILAEVEQKVGLGGKLKKEFEKVEGNALIIQNSLLKTEDTLLFIEAMESAASKTNNTYSTNVVQEIKDESGKITTINFNIELSGNFSTLVSFLREIEEMPYLMNFIQVSVSVEDDETLNTKATLQVYIQ